MKNILVLYDDKSYVETQINGTSEQIKNYYKNSGKEDLNGDYHKLLTVLFECSEKEFLDYMKTKYINPEMDIFYIYHYGDGYKVNLSVHKKYYGTIDAGIVEKISTTDTVKQYYITNE